MQTPTSVRAASSAGTTHPVPSARLRYTILSNDGYLVANHTPNGLPISVVGRPELATSFVDIDSAIRGINELHQLGWHALCVVSFYP